MLLLALIGIGDAWALPGGLRVGVVHAGTAVAVTDGAAPVCRPLVADALDVCLRVRAGGEERWAEQSDLDVWRVDASEAWAVVARRAGRRARASMRRVEVEGLDASYWQADRGDGWAGAILLRPDVAAAWLGPGVHVAAPSFDVVLAWAPQGRDVDLVMAVGAADMFAAQARPVHDGVFAIGPQGWTLYGTATQPSGAPR